MILVWNFLSLDYFFSITNSFLVIDGTGIRTHGSFESFNFSFERFFDCFFDQIRSLPFLFNSTEPDLGNDECLIDVDPNHQLRQLPLSPSLSISLYPLSLSLSLFITLSLFLPLSFLISLYQVID